MGALEGINPGWYKPAAKKVPHVRGKHPSVPTWLNELGRRKRCKSEPCWGIWAKMIVFPYHKVGEFEILLLYLLDPQWSKELKSTYSWVNEMVTNSGQDFPHISVSLLISGLRPSWWNIPLQFGKIYVYARKSNSRDLKFISQFP